MRLEWVGWALGMHFCSVWRLENSEEFTASVNFSTTYCLYFTKATCCLSDVYSILILSAHSSVRTQRGLGVQTPLVDWTKQNRWLSRLYSITLHDQGIWLSQTELGTLVSNGSNGRTTSVALQKKNFVNGKPTRQRNPLHHKILRMPNCLCVCSAGLQKGHPDDEETILEGYIYYSRYIRCSNQLSITVYWNVMNGVERYCWHLDMPDI